MIIIDPVNDPFINRPVIPFQSNVMMLIAPAHLIQMMFWPMTLFFPFPALSFKVYIFLHRLGLLSIGIYIQGQEHR
jgi:hypothetical protein